MDNAAIDVRPLAARDSIESLTALLHRSYAPLAALGMNYTAAAQSVDVTARRVAEGQCFVAVSGAELVGTVTVAGPSDGPFTWQPSSPRGEIPSSATTRSA